MITINRISAKFLVIASTLFLAVFGCVPMFSKQTTTKQPQSTVRLEDNSDWWSLTRENADEERVTYQGRELSRSNFQILGISLDEDLFRRAVGKLGRATSVERGEPHLAGTSFVTCQSVRLQKPISS